MLSDSLVDNLVLFIWSSIIFYKDEKCIDHIHNTNKFLNFGVIQLIVSIKLK